MSFTATWDDAFTGSPLDGDRAKQGAGIIRALKLAIKERQINEHYWDGDFNDGIHKFLRGNNADRPPPLDGRLYLNTERFCLEYTAGGSWQSAFAAGTKMLFVGTAVPVGWNLDPSFNDKVLRVVNSAPLGGGAGGSWVISGINLAGGHNHDFSGITGSRSLTDTLHLIYGAGASTADPLQSGNAHTHAFAGTTVTEPHHIHSFDGNWRPAYVNVLVGVKT